MILERPSLMATHLHIDRDTKYAARFGAVFEAGGVEVTRVGPQAPNVNACAERWVQTLRQKCLDHSS